MSATGAARVLLFAIRPWLVLRTVKFKVRTGIAYEYIRHVLISRDLPCPRKTHPKMFDGV